MTQDNRWTQEAIEERLDDALNEEMLDDALNEEMLDDALKDDPTGFDPSRMVGKGDAE